MDVEMTDTSHGRSSETITVDNDLVKTVRSLDQTGAGVNGENLERIWKQLTSIGQSQFSAAEESVLRWLLKTMKSNNDDSDTIRRFPLTWRIIGCSFQRIPLFSLAKSLADRKFMAVLQQTLKSVAQPSTEAEATSKKRKRTSTAKFDLESLKSYEGCLVTGEAIFGALSILVARLDPAAQWSAHDRMGAEHIKALFAQPAKEAIEHLAPLLTICKFSLEISEKDVFERQESWAEVAASIWDLHLQGSEDALDFATSLARTALSILSKLEDSSVGVGEAIVKQWTRELEKFLQRSLVLPVRSAYFNKTDIEIITRAYSMVQRNAATSVPTLYRMVSSAPQVVGGLTTTKANEAWMQEVFKLSERSLRQLSDNEKAQALGAILEQAIANKSRVALDDLRAVCGSYALAGSSSKTDWRLLLLIAKCDADVFLQSDNSLELFDQVCERITTVGLDAGEETMTELIESLITGFQSNRDLSTFLQKWFSQLSKFEDKGLRTGNRPVWFTHVHRNATLIDGIEKHLTTKQLVTLLQWVDDQEVSRSAATFVFLNTIASAVTKDEYADAIGTQMSNLTLKSWSSSKAPSDIRCLRWRIISKTVSWSSYERCAELLGKVRADLTKALQKAKFDDEDTCEALECAYQFWLAAHPDGSEQSDLAALLVSFVERLLKKVKLDEVQDLLDTRGALTLDNSEVSRFCAEYPLTTSRLVALLSKSSGSLPDYLEKLLGGKDDSETRLGNAIHVVISNENNLHNRKLMAGLVDHVTEIIAKVSSKSSPWTEKRSRTALVELSRIPNEAITRPQRERVMEILIPRIHAASQLSSADWNLVLGLLWKMMSKPTFYKNMAFSDLQKLATSLAPVCNETNSSTALGLCRLLSRITRATVRQMNDHQEYRMKYFENLSWLFKESTGDDTSTHMTLLRALLHIAVPKVVGMERTEVFDSAKALTALRRMIQEALSDFGKSCRKLKVNTASVNRMLIALEAADILPSSDVNKLKLDISQLEESSQRAIADGYVSGWKLRSFLIRRFPSQVAEPRPASFNQLFSNALCAPLPSGPAPDPLSDFDRRAVLEDCVDAVISSLGHNDRVVYVESLLDGVQESSTESTEGQLLAVRYVVSETRDNAPDFENTPFDLASAHGVLIHYLSKAKTIREFVRTAENLQQLLDIKASSMTQWNIDTTLSTVTTIAATDPTQLLRSSPSVYQWLCKLVEVIIKKHRQRLEGHSHILVVTLEALLVALTGPGPREVRAKHATQFTRLVTLVCEPAAAAVSRVQHFTALHSATDEAKRSAGRHMYLVLMAYVKMQLDVDVPREVREALEPGMNSIFAITPRKIRQILNDGMDHSGRAILREMYKRYEKFGKWSGV
ncbi:Nucleolar pre-ribosomal-associated protein 2 [Colletotrichum spinosum]|uniref:Nucleolar pre-ribosomal-associated protein 2 n=1 Tax=Colletotrichum spinosum TaxID=1347390 RepID=A0A4V3HSU6_9PEZI|nr:Nucleolar pre-ribosomal-associated protein 2 [Colletotrichum spinosum]